VLSVAAVSALVVAESVILLALILILTVGDVEPRGTMGFLLESVVTLSYLSALACLHAVSFPEGLVGGVFDASVLFNIALVSLVVSVEAMFFALSPERVVSLLG
jgi:hypothetical protein